MELSAIIFRPPRIETDRLVLRGYEPGDAPNILAYASEPETTRFMSWDRAKGIEDVDLFLSSFVGPHYERGELDYAVTLRGQEDRCIGGVGAYWRPREHQVMELGYILHRDYWGQGLIPEAARALIHHAFATTKVERIYAPIFAPNVKSRRAAEKIGMQLDGVLRSQRLLRGQRLDEAIYSVLRQDVRETGWSPKNRTHS